MTGVQTCALPIWFLRAAEDGRTVGYTGGRVEPETNRFFISKIYLRAEERGHRFASQTIRFYEDLCRARGLAALYLTVNKHNDLGVRAYRGKGFETIDSVETDIGQQDQRSRTDRAASPISASGVKPSSATAASWAITPSTAAWWKLRLQRLSPTALCC